MAPGAFEKMKIQYTKVHFVKASSMHAFRNIFTGKLFQKAIFLNFIVTLSNGIFS